MIREEEIKCASKDYVNYLLDKQEYHNEDYTEDDIRQAFEKGAMFADRNPDLSALWHDAGEEPQGEYEIIYQDEFNHVWLATYRKDIEQYKNWWEECVACNYIVHWAYISDLLPKGSTKRVEG